MATTPRQRNARPFGIFATQAERDDGAGVTIDATTYSKPMYGPKDGGCAAVHLVWGAGFTGNVTIQYSLKPNPELTTDDDWVTDTGATVVGDSLTIAAGAGKAIIFVGNVLPEWFRLKVTRTGGSASFRGWARVEGDNR